ARADLYSVGILLYQLLSGRLPFMGSNAEELLRNHREHLPLRLRDAGKRVHPDLEALLAQLLAKDPAHRPSSGDELAVIFRALAPVADLAPAEEGAEAIEDPVPVVALPPPEPAMMGEVGAQRPITRPGIPKWAPVVLPAWWPLAAAGALVVIVLAIVLLARGSSKPKTTPPPPQPTPIAVPAPPPVVPAPS